MIRLLGRLLEEATDGTEGAAGSEADLNLDIGKVIDEHLSTSDLGLGDPEPGSATPSLDDGKAKAEVQAKAKADEEAKAAAAKAGLPQKRAVPKSWKPEFHPHWEKVDPAVQAYIEQRETEMAAGVEPFKGEAAYAKSIRDVMAPYQPVLDASGIKDHAEAVRSLMGAHYQLSHGTMEERSAAYAKYAQFYKLDPALVAKSLTNEAPYQDPQFKPLLDKVTALETSVTSERTARAQEQMQKLSAEVKAFAEDPAHPHFAEVAGHIKLLLGNPALSLKEAYEQAVWANPVTRAKEQERIQKDTDAARRKKAEEDAAAAKKAKGTRVRGRESEKEPQSLIGSIDDTMKDTMREIKSRAE